jgi:anti-anti-sigma factor
MTTGRHVAVKHLPEKLGAKQGRHFFREVEPHLQADRPRVVLDCSRIRHVDSAGIHALLCCLEEAMKRNGDVKLAGIPPGVAAILELTRAGGLFEAFDSTAQAVNSFHQFPMKPVQKALAWEYPALASSAYSGLDLDLDLDDDRSDSGKGPRSMEATTRISGRWLTLQIAVCLMFLLVAPHAAAFTTPQQETNPSRQDVSAAQAQSQDSDGGARKPSAGPSETEVLPNSPGAVRSQTADNQPFRGQQPSPNQPKNETQEPVGTAAAGFIKTTGVAASKPAGAAIAPAKQRRARSILIKVGAIMGAGVAVGTVVALSSSSPSRPAGAH